RTITRLLRCAIPGSAASAPSHGSFAAPSLAPLHPHHHTAPSLRHPWLRCIRTITRLLRCAIPGSAASAPSLTLQDADEVLLQARAARRMPDSPMRVTVRNAARDLTDPDQAGTHHRVRRQRAAR